MIYFIRAKKSGNIKIGYSINPDKRKATLQTAHYEDLEFIGIMNGTLDDEAKIHAMFSQFNIRGEWFLPTQEVMNFVQEYANKPKINIVTSLGNNEFSITFAQPFKFTMNFFLLSGTHNIKILSDRDMVMVFGVDGKRDVLLNWLGSLQGIAEIAMREFENSMTE